MCAALTNTFSDTYDRDRQFVDLSISPQLPKKQQEYPCIVVEYEGQTVQNSGIGHEEWFDDTDGNLQKWHHNRFEGNLNFDIYTLSTIDRDTLVDALVEVLRFGRLDAALLPFFTTVYGDPNDPVELIFNQMMLNVDIVHEHGNSQSPAPWRPEDQLLYTTGVSIDCHGGYYNIVPDVTWTLVERVTATPYPQFEEQVTIPLVNDAQPPTPLANSVGQITNPRQFYDDNEMQDPTVSVTDPPVPNTLKGVAVISGDEEYDPA